MSKFRLWQFFLNNCSPSRNVSSLKIGIFLLSFIWSCVKQVVISLPLKQKTTCLIHDQINVKREMPILSEETFLESGQLFKSKFGHMCCELDSMSKLSEFVYIKSHVTLHAKSKAQKVNWPRMLKVAPCTVVRSYIQIFSAWWVTTILYNYGATRAPLLLNIFHINWQFQERWHWNNDCLFIMRPIDLFNWF